MTLEMPNLSPTMEKGNIGTWTKKVGDKIQPGDVLCSIETDKATVDFEMQDEGYIAKTFFSDGAKDIPLGTPLCIVVDSEDEIAAFKDYVPAAATAAEPTPAAATPAAPTSAAPAQAAPSTPSAPVQSGDRKFVSPLAANMAQSHGINLAQVGGSGPGGRIIRADIEDALAHPPAAQQAAQAAPQLVSAPGAGYKDLPNSQIRKVIADRLTFAKQNIPHYYVTV